MGLDAQAALFRSVMADRWMLVVLDNARDADHVRPLLPASPGCLVVVTSRHRLTGLVAAEAARVVTLGLLSTGEAMELLGQRLGRGRLDAEPEAVFSWSYEALDPGAARLFRLVGLHPGHDVTAATAAGLAGMTRSEVAPLLAELSRGHLLAEHVPGRFAAHDLLRVYAAELAARLVIIAFVSVDPRGFSTLTSATIKRRPVTASPGTITNLFKALHTLGEVSRLFPNTEDVQPRRDQP